jgi:putative membrane protein
MTYVLFRYLHLLAVLALAGGIIIENMAIKPQIDSEDARNLARVDAFCGISVLLIIIFGLILWIAVGKPAEFYSGNPLFQAKLGLFGLLIATATYPALFFFRNRRYDGDSLTVPGGVRLCLKLEVGLLLIIPILATLMARGIGIPA